MNGTALWIMIFVYMCGGTRMFLSVFLFVYFMVKSITDYIM